MVNNPTDDPIVFPYFTPLQPRRPMTATNTTWRAPKNIFVRTPLLYVLTLVWVLGAPPRSVVVFGALVVALGAFSTLGKSESDTDYTAGVMFGLLSLSTVIVIATSQILSWYKVSILTVVVLGIAIVTRSLTPLSGYSTHHKVFLAVLSSLILQGYVFLLPLAVATTITILLSRDSPNPRVWTANVTIFAAASIVSRIWCNETDGRLFVTNDQIYRSSLATSLTRWGWTDWNAATGFPIRYHWLSEATAGLLSRVSGIDELRTVVVIWPALLTWLAIHYISELFADVNMRSLRLCTSVALVTLLPNFDVSSIGTLLGGVLLVSTARILIQTLRSHEFRKPRSLSLVALGFVGSLLFLAQVHVGIFVAAALGIMMLYNAICKTRFALLTPLLIIGTFAVLLASTVLRSAPLREGRLFTPTLRVSFFPSQGTLDLASLFGEYGLTVTPLALFAIYGLVPFAIRHQFGQSSILTIFQTTSVIGSVIALMTLNLGQYSGKLGIEAIHFVLLVTFGTAAHRLARSGSWIYLATMGMGTAAALVAFRITHDSRMASSLLLLMPIGMLVVAIVIFLLLQHRGGCASLASLRSAVIICFSVLLLNVAQLDRRFDLLVRGAGPLREVIAEPGTYECLTWIRNNTAPNTIVASNMWRVPQLEDQKYFLVSLETKRRLLLDGPDTVIGTGVYGASEARSYIEGTKDLIDRIVSEPRSQDIRSLQKLGASVLIVDRGRIAINRIDWFLRPVIIEPSCSVHLLNDPVL